MDAKNIVLGAAAAGITGKAAVIAKAVSAAACAHPLIAVPVVAAGGIVIGGCVLHKLYNKQKILCLGMAGAGKTTFCNAWEAIINDNKCWEAEKYDSTLEIVEHKCKTASFVDTAGTHAYKKSWSSVVSSKNPDVIYYFYDISRLTEVITLENNFKCYYFKCVAADLKILSGLCNQNQKKLIIIGTHADIEHDDNLTNKCLADAFSYLADCQYGRVEGSIISYESAKDLLNKIDQKIESM